MLSEIEIQWMARKYSDLNLCVCVCVFVCVCVCVCCLCGFCVLFVFLCDQGQVQSTIDLVCCDGLRLTQSSG